MQKSRRRSRAGFTLIELLVVVIIIGILSGIGMSQYRDAQDRARNASMMDLVKGVQLGVETYKTDWNTLPVDLVGPDPKLYLAANAQSLAGSWPVKYTPGGLLPRTPWADTAQMTMDSTYYNNSALSTPWSQLLGRTTGGNPTTTVDELLAAGISDGAESQIGSVPTPGIGPAIRTNYGYVYYIGDANSGRYFIAGIGKHLSNPPVVMIKGN